MIVLSMLLSLFLGSSAFAWSVPFKPSGELLSNPDTFTALEAIMWLIKGISMLICVWLLIKTSKLLSQENYIQAGTTLIGAILAGGSLYLALPFSK